MTDLTGHVALVTGASAGLGRRAALVLSAAGANVVAVARRAEALASLAREAEGIAPLAHDLADRGGLPELAAKAAEPFGAPDILVHAAGINTREFADEVTPEGWDATLNLNLAVPINVLKSKIKKDYPAKRKLGQSGGASSW